MPTRNWIVMAALGAGMLASAPASAQESVARQWNEVLLEAIRNDLARPTVHARNLYHTTMAMWDAWATFEIGPDQIVTDEYYFTGNPTAAQEEAMSFAAYRVLQARFATSPGAAISLPLMDDLMDALGYDKDNHSTVGVTPAAIGNRIAINVLFFGLSDGANEAGAYEETVGYEPVNEPLIVDLPGNPTITDPNRWQPLALEFFVDQAGNPIPGGNLEFLGPHWGNVTPFALEPSDRTGNSYFDPGPPPQHGGSGDAAYRQGMLDIVQFSSWATPDDGVMVDCSPASVGNNTLGQNDGSGYDLNPVTGLPYTPQIVPRGDFGRVIAEFWADGPESETPPGHWNTIANFMTDHPFFTPKLAGEGDPVPQLEWDIKMYLMLNGAVHDSAIAAWENKWVYDYIRPISGIRYMADQGQSSDPQGPSYHPDGIPLVPGLVEVITLDSIAPGERHEHLAGDANENVGKIALYAWQGYVDDPATEYGGVDWILAGNWVPYQRGDFVTPPFAAYVSGHSTFSRAAAEVLTALTGSAFFPGGLATWSFPQGSGLSFEYGPSQSFSLQWATYYDASDQSGISRLYGGIHVPADDGPGRIIGQKIGAKAIQRAVQYFNGQVSCPFDVSGDGQVGFPDVLTILSNWGPCPTLCGHDLDGDGAVGFGDLLIVLSAVGTVCE